MSDKKAKAFHSLRSNLYAVGFCWRNAKGLFFANLFDILFGGLFDPAYLIVTAALFGVLEQSGRFRDALGYVLLMALMLAARIAWSQLYQTILKPVLYKTLNARVHRMLFEKSAQMGLERYDDPAFYDSFLLAMDHTDTYITGAIGNLSTVIKFSLTVIVLVAGKYLPRHCHPLRILLEP